MLIISLTVLTANIAAFFFLPKMSSIKQSLLFRALASFSMALPCSFIIAEIFIYDYQSYMFSILWAVPVPIVIMSTLIISTIKIRKGLYASKRFTYPDAVNYSIYGALGASFDGFLMKYISDDLQFLVIIVVALLLKCMMFAGTALSIQRYYYYTKLEKQGLITEDVLKIGDK